MIEERTSRIWSKGLQHASGLLIKRGTAMGPLVPILLLVPFFLIFSYLFKTNIFVCSALLVLAGGIVFEYFRQFSHFANKDPDRLQSEEYRYEMKKIEVVAAKELKVPLPLAELNLSDPGPNPANPLSSMDSIEQQINHQKPD
jgi:hypothetical protein